MTAEASEREQEVKLPGTVVGWCGCTMRRVELPGRQAGRQAYRRSAITTGTRIEFIHQYNFNHSIRDVYLKLVYSALGGDLTIFE